MVMPFLQPTISESLGMSCSPGHWDAQRWGGLWESLPHTQKGIQKKTCHFLPQTLSWRFYVWNHGRHIMTMMGVGGAGNKRMTKSWHHCQQPRILTSLNYCINQHWSNWPALLLCDITDVLIVLATHSRMLCWSSSYAWSQSIVIGTGVMDVQVAPKCGTRVHNVGKTSPAKKRASAKTQTAVWERKIIT